MSHAVPSSLLRAGGFTERRLFSLHVPAVRVAGMLAAIATALLASSSAKAQDFDCGSAKLAAERAICASPRLTRLDNRVATLYGLSWKRLDNDNREGLRDHQLDFLKRRNACGGNERCIASRYEEQLRILRSRLMRR